MSQLLAAVSVARQAVISLFVDSAKPGFARNAQRARSAVRDCYFQSRAQIPVVTLPEFLNSISPHVPSQVSLLTEIANEGVGTVTYFHALAGIAATLKPRNIVEFGTYLGLSTRIFALNSDAEILTVDLPDDQNADDIETLNAVDRGHVSRSRSRVGSYYKNTPEQARITELRCDSRTLDLPSIVPSADLVYVDGGHDTASVSADTRNAFKVLRPGGVLLWDDYFWLCPDVVHFLDEIAKNRHLVRIAETYLVAYTEGA